MKKIVRKPKWGTSSPSVIVLVGEDGNKDIASEESKAKAKSRTDTRTTLAHFLKLVRPPLCPAISRPQHLYSTYMHTTRGYNGYLLAYFQIFFCARHTLRMRIPSIKFYNLPSCLLLHSKINYYHYWKSIDTNTELHQAVSNDYS